MQILNQYPLAMVNLMLDNLSSKAGEPLFLRFEFYILIQNTLHLSAAVLQ